MYIYDDILSDREITGMKMILSVTRDPEIKKILNRKVMFHNFQIELRDTRRKILMARKRIIGK